MLAGASVAGTVVVALMFPGRPRVFQLSIGLAYASLALLSVTLILGPWNVLRNRANPLSTDLRRDMGIWAVVCAAAHVVFGLQVHLSGAMLQYFLWPPESGHALPFRYDLPGAANFSGLGSALVLLLLLALSNDAALRGLGPKRWKALQRWNYAGFALMGFHAAAYQLIEKRTLPWMVLVASTMSVVVATQVGGWRRRVRHP